MGTDGKRVVFALWLVHDTLLDERWLEAVISRWY